MPLSGLKVLDLCRARAGPTAVRQLADWGADVIKIELPPATGEDNISGERYGFDFQNLHRNKRSLTLNLKDTAGRDVFLRMVEDADVVIENFRPRVKHRLKIDYETLSAINPRLVYGSISGFGQAGPYAERPGLDQIAQGIGGLMSVTGEPGRGPMRVGIPIADLTSGFNLALGVMIALYEREKSGKGQWVHTSLLEAQITMMDFQAARYLFNDEVAQQAGNNHPTGIPTGVFKTSDGAVNIQAGSNHMYARLCDALKADDLANDPRFKSYAERAANRDTLNELIEAKTASYSTAGMIDLLAEIGVPCGPIHDVGQTFADPQVQALQMTPEFHSEKLGVQRLVGQAINMSRTPESINRATPDAGEHTDEILAGYGYSESEIGALRERKVI